MPVTLRTIKGKFLTKGITQVSFIPTSDVTIDGTDQLTGGLPLVIADVVPSTGEFTAAGLPPTSGTGIVPPGWTYRVEILAAGTRGAIRNFAIQVPPHTTGGTAPDLQLASLAPVASPGEVALYLTEAAADNRYVQATGLDELLATLVADEDSALGAAIRALAPQAPTTAPGALTLALAAGVGQVTATVTGGKDGIVYALYQGTSVTGAPIATAFPATVTGLTDNIPVSLVATVANGIGTTTSNVATITPGPAAKPTTLTLAASAGDAVVTLNASGGKNRDVAFAIYRGTTATGTPIATAFPFSDTGRVNGTAYSYIATATNEFGVTTSNTVTVTPAADAADADIVATTAAAPTVTRVATPFSGSKVPTSTSVYTPMWSTKDHTFISQPVTVNGVPQSRVARLTPAGVVEQEVFNTVADGNAHDVFTGHRLASVAVSDAGTVVYHPERHEGAWIGKHSTSPRDISTLTATSVPAGQNTRTSYRRFFRDAWTGDLWMVVRGNDYRARIYLWDESGKGWAVKGSNPISPDRDGIGAYGFELAFGNGVMYLVTEYRVNGGTGAQSGFPRRDIGVVKSTDKGTTWTTMTGTTVTAPFEPGATTMIFPGVGAVTSAVAANHTGVLSRVMVDANNRPVVVAAWKHPTKDATYRSLWVATFDADGTMKRRRLLPAKSDWSVGNAWAAYTKSGLLMVAVSERDDHLPDASNTSSSEVDSTNYPDSALFLFTSTDGTNWTRRTLDPGNLGNGYSGAFIDQNAHRVQGVIKVSPISQLKPTLDEVWSFTIPELPAADTSTGETGTDTTGASVAPVTISGTSGSTGPSLSWTARNGAVSYAVYESTTTPVSTSGTPTATVTTNSWSRTDGALSASRYYKVVVRNLGAVKSADSNELTLAAYVAPPAGVTTFSDDFNRADGAVGNGWTANARTSDSSTTAATWQTVSNVLAVTAASITQNATYHLISPTTFDPANIFAQIDVTAKGTGTTANHPRVMLHYVDQNNYVEAFYDDSSAVKAWVIKKADGSTTAASETTLASFAETSPTLPYTVRLEFKSGVYTLKAAAQGSTPAAKTTFTATSAEPTTGSKAGIVNRTGGPSSATATANMAQRTDNFTASSGAL